MQMKMGFCCEVKHFNGARTCARMTRSATRGMHVEHDNNDFSLQHKDFGKK